MGYLIEGVNIMLENIERNCLSYWFPKLELAGLPVPKTRILRMSEECQRQVYTFFDGDPKQGVPLELFCRELGKLADEIGLPCFLRTGQTSGKHSWDKTCYLTKVDDICNHVIALAEYSECCGMIGVPWDVWAVREFLPTKPIAVCPRDGNMPVNNETRFFFSGGEIVCWHPYWPLKALLQGGLSDEDAIFCYEQQCKPVVSLGLPKKAGNALEGDWSIDVLQSTKGVFVIDCAVAGDSWHWPGCSQVKRFNKS